MINSTKLVNSTRKAKLIDIDRFRESFVIIPYKVSGFINFANTGRVDANDNPINYETFKRVWTGNDACVISWKESIFTTQDPDTSLFKTNYQLGNVFLGELVDNKKDVSIAKDESFSEYISQETRINLEFRVSNYFEIDNTYEFMFFKFPELYGSTLFRIDSNEAEYLGTELQNYRIKFKSINQEFSNTGRARQQNIMPNSPGQGYLEPVVYNEDWPSTFPPGEFDKLIEGQDYYKLFNRYITADKKKINNRPIKKVVLKLFGAGILNSFSAVGRPARNDGSFEDFGIPRLLFPYNLKPASTPTLYRSQQATSNFYFGSFVPSLLFMKDAMSQVKDSMTPLNKWSSQGTILYDRDAIKATNPIINGSYKSELYGYFEDNSWNPFQPQIPQQDVITSMIEGCSGLYKTGGIKNIQDHLFDNYFTQKNMKTLPMNANSSLGFGFTLGSAIGAAVTKQFWMGLSLTLIGILSSIMTKIYSPKFTQFNGLVSAELIDLNDQYGQDSSSNNKLSMNILLSQSVDNPSSIFFDGSTMQTAFEAELTDNFLSLRTGQLKIVNTSNIGQKTFEDGTNILTDGSPFLLNGDTTLMPTNDNNGFIIDSFQIQAMFNGEISVEFLDENEDVAWSGVYQSEGKWTNSLREIWTEKQTSIFGRENMFFSEPLPYPKLLPPPILLPGNIGAKNIQINHRNVFGLAIRTGYTTQFVNGQAIAGSGVEDSNKSFMRTYTLIDDISFDQLQVSYSRVEVFLQSIVNDGNQSDLNVSNPILMFDLGELTTTNELILTQTFKRTNKYTTWHSYLNLIKCNYYLTQTFTIKIYFRNNKLLMDIIGSALFAGDWTGGNLNLPITGNFKITGETQLRSALSTVNNVILRPRR